jgi:hypothetical protein
METLRGQAQYYMPYPEQRQLPSDRYETQQQSPLHQRQQLQQQQAQQAIDREKLTQAENQAKEIAAISGNCALDDEMRELREILQELGVFRMLLGNR